MPANPGEGADLAAVILEAIHRVEQWLLSLITSRLRAGIFTPGWEGAKLAEMRLLEQRLIAGVQNATPEVLAAVAKVVGDAYTRGQALAVLDLQDAKLPWNIPTATQDVIDRIAQSAAVNVRAALDTAPQLLMDVYRQAVEAGVAQVLGGTLTRVQASQQVLDELAARGITGFRDSAGRNWSLESYAEMAVRTGAGHAAVQGHVDALAASGIDLIIVSDAPRECPLCRPWERKVLSISGRVGALIEPSVTTGNPVTVHVTASLEEARLAGFQHPNCRHSISAYLPGATVKGTPKPDPARYEAGQRQREIERHIREWKRRQLVALDDAAARRAAVKIRDWQAVLREHIDLYDLTRLRRREQIGRAV